MLRFIKMAGRPYLGFGGSVILLCFTLWIGDVPRATAQGGSIVIDGNLLGGIIARGLLGKQPSQQNYTPRTSGPRSRSTTRSASDSNIRKEQAKRTRSRAARNSAKPVREENRSKAGDVATGSPAQQQGTITHLNAEPSPTVSVPPAPAPIPPTQAVAPVFAPPSALSPPAAAATMPATQPFDARDTASAAISTSAEITLAQGHLQFMGYDVPQASGSVDLKTKIAIMQFQDSIGAPTTGHLTRGQLQMLFQKAATRLQGGGSPAERGVTAKENNGEDRPSVSERREGDPSSAKASASSETPARAKTTEDDKKSAGRRARPKAIDPANRRETRAESRPERGRSRDNASDFRNSPASPQDNALSREERSIFGNANVAGPGRPGPLRSKVERPRGNAPSSMNSPIVAPDSNKVDSPNGPSKPPSRFETLFGNKAVRTPDQVAGPQRVPPSPPSQILRSRPSPALEALRSPTSPSPLPVPRNGLDQMLRRDNAVKNLAR